MNYRKNDEHSVTFEREKLKRVIEERALIEDMMKENEDYTAVRNELAATNRKEILKPIRRGKKNTHYVADGRSYYDQSGISSNTEYLGPKHDVSKMLESEQLVIRVMKEIEERKKLRKTPIAELYKSVMKEKYPPNKYTAIRKLGEFLEEEEFTAEEIALMRTLMKKIIKKNQGSKEELLLSLYIEERL